MQQQPKFIDGRPFYRGFKTPVLEHLIDGGLNAAQLTGQLDVCIQNWIQAGIPSWVQIQPIIVLPTDLFTSSL